MTRVLVVDDNRQVRELIVRVLESLGWAVDSAADAAEAMDRASEGPLDLLVTDVSLMGTSGMRLAHDLRLLRPDVRVLYVSGHEPGELARMAAADRLPAPVAGERDAFLRKPFGLAELRDAVVALLGSIVSAPVVR